MVIRMGVVVVIIPGGGDGEVDLPAGHQGSFVLGHGGHWLITGLQQQCALQLFVAESA